MKCQYCNGACIKKGCYKRRQLYRCKNCLKYQRAIYYRIRVPYDKKEMVNAFITGGLSIRSMSRLLKTAKSTVQRIIEEEASDVKKPRLEEEHQQATVWRVKHRSTKYTFLQNLKQI